MRDSNETVLVESYVSFRIDPSCTLLKNGSVDALLALDEGRFTAALALETGPAACEKSAVCVEIPLPGLMTISNLLKSYNRNRPTHHSIIFGLVAKT